MIQTVRTIFPKTLICLLVFLVVSCQPDYKTISLSKFESLVKAEVVNRMVIVKDRNRVEIYLNQSKIHNSSFANEFDSHEALALEKINEDYFLAKYEEFIYPKDINAVEMPSLVFESRPTFMDFMTTYGFLAILLFAFIVLGIAFPIIIFSQKRKIKDLETQISLLHDQKQSSKPK